MDSEFGTMFVTEFAKDIGKIGLIRGTSLEKGRKEGKLDVETGRPATVDGLFVPLVIFFISP